MQEIVNYYSASKFAYALTCPSYLHSQSTDTATSDEGTRLHQQVYDDVFNGHFQTPQGEICKQLIADGYTLYQEHKLVGKTPLCHDIQGTADVVATKEIYNGRRVFIIDWKFGFHKVPITSLQLAAYGWMACELYGGTELAVGIYQPNISAKLQQRDLPSIGSIPYVLDAIIVQAEQGMTGVGYQCRWCNRTETCQSFQWQLHKMSSASKVEACRAYQLVTPLIERYKDEIRAQLESGLPVEGAKLQQGRRMRKWSLPDDELIPMLRKINPALVKEVPIKVTDAIDQMGKALPSILVTEVRAKASIKYLNTEVDDE